MIFFFYKQLKGEDGGSSEKDNHPWMSNPANIPGQI